MLKRTLGRSGIQVSALGLGCWAIGGPWDWVDGEDKYPAGWGDVDDNESIRAVHAGLDAGIDFYDTAGNYGAGHSEVILSKALAGRRDKVVIATKFGHLVNEETKEVQNGDDQILENVRKDIENSLRRLNTDYVDIYQLHAAGYDPELALQLRDVLEDLVKEGKIRWYGWSTDLPERAAIFAEGKHCTSIQFALNIFTTNPKMRALCEEKNLAGVNKSPLSRGILTGKFTEESKLPENDVRRGFDFTEGPAADRMNMLSKVREIMTSNGHTPAQASLAYIWALDQNQIPIPGFKNVRQVEENAKALELGPLSDEQMKAIQEMITEPEEVAGW